MENDSEIWDKFYNEYPVNQELIWLNNCGTTPASISAITQVHSYMLEYSKRGVLNESFKYIDIKRKIKSILSSLLNCDPDELALIHHTSEGMNFISHGLDLKKGDKILLLEDEYPSNVYPFEHWKEKGVELDFISLAPTEEEFLLNTEKKISQNVRAISISAVHWCTGMPLPIEKIGELCAKKNIDFILDGAQGIGHTQVDVQKANISYMAFPAWKWLLGPLGLGVLYIKKEKLDVLKPIFKGQNSVEGGEEYLPYKKNFRRSADRFEISTSNFSDWIYFLATLESLEKVGFEKIQKRLYTLGDFLKAHLKEIGMEVYSERFR